MKNLIVITFLAFGFLLSMSNCKNEAKPASTKTEKSGDHDLLLVKYHADWCGSCKALTPMLAELNTKLAGKKVQYVELDFTDDKTTAAARSRASQLGISAFLKEKQKTGYVAIIDVNSKKELGKLTKTQSVNEMYKQVTGSL